MPLLSGLLLHEETEGASIFATHLFTAPPMLEGHAEHGPVAWRWSWGSAHGEYLLSEAVDTAR